MFVCSLLGLAACVFLLFALSHSPPTIYDLAVDLSCCDLNNPNCAQGVPVALSMGTTGELTFLNGVQCIAAPSPTLTPTSPSTSNFSSSSTNSTTELNAVHAVLPDFSLPILIVLSLIN